MEQLRNFFKDGQKFYPIWLMGIFLVIFTAIKLGIIMYVLQGLSPTDYNQEYRINFFLSNNVAENLSHPWVLIMSIFSIENYLKLIKYFIFLAILFYYIKNLFRYKKLVFFVFIVLLSVNVFRLIGLFFQLQGISEMLLPTTYFLWLLACLNIVTQRRQLFFEQLGSILSASTFFALILIADLCIFNSFNLWNAVVLLYFYVLAYVFCQSKNNLLQT